MSPRPLDSSGMAGDPDELGRGFADSARLLLGSLVAAALGIVSLRLLLSGLPEAEFGRYALLQGVGGVLALLVAWPAPAMLRLGTEEAVAHGGAVGRTLASICALVLLTAPLLLGGAWLARAPLEATLGIGAVPWSPLLAYAVASGLGNVGAALLQPTGRVGLRTLVPAATRGLHVALLLWAVTSWGLDLPRALVLTAISAAPSIVLPLLIAGRRLRSFAPDAGLARRAGAFGAPLLARTLVAWGLSVCGQLLLRSDPVAVARFDVAFRLAEQAVVFGFALDFVAGPLLAGAAARGETGAPARLLGLAAPPLLLTWALAAGLLGAAGEPLLALLGAPHPAASAPALTLLALAVAARGPSLLDNPLFDAHLLSFWPTAFLGASLALGAGLGLALVDAGWGPLGPAVALACAWGLNAGLRSLYAARVFGAPVARVWLALLPAPAALGLAHVASTHGWGLSGRLAAWALVALVTPALARAAGLLPAEAALVLGRVRMPAGLRRLITGRFSPGRAPGERPRLLLLTTELRRAGAEGVVEALALGLRDRWQVVVASLTSVGGGDGAVADDLRAAGVEVRCLRLAGKADLLRGAWRVLRLVRELRPDVLHAHLVHAALAARVLGRLAGARRVVTTVHVVERRRLPLRRLLERLTAGLDDRTTCVSDAVAVHARDDLGARAPVVVENGIDLARFAPPADPAGSRAAARATLGLPPDARVVGAVARLTAQKGLDDLLRAFARVAPERPDALLVLVGEGEEAAALDALAAELGLSARVRRVGFRRDVPEVLRALDALAMPSRWEGFGLALVEGLAAGVPCVAAAVDSLPGVLGDAGLLVPPGDVPALAAALGRLLDEPALRADLARRGPAQAKRYDVRTMVEGYERVYRELRDPPLLAPERREAGA